MSSRQEEKEARRQERLKLERAEAAAAARKKQMGYLVGGLLALAALAGIVLLGISALGGDDNSAKTKTTPVAADLPKLPPQQESDWQKAAKAAGCELINPPFEGAGHEEKTFKASDYKTNPPTTGLHHPAPTEDGEFGAEGVGELGGTLHAMEHGRVLIQYRKGTPEATVNKLRAFFSEQNDGYHLLLFENTTNMPYEVAATAWTHILGCKTYNDKVIDALRTFRLRYIDKGPERVP